MVKEGSKNRGTLYWGVVVAVMIIIFVAIRQLWQHGSKPLKGLPLAAQTAISITILVLVCIAAYFIHKTYKA